MRVRIFEKSTLLPTGDVEVSYFAKRQRRFLHWSWWTDVTEPDWDDERVITAASIDVLLDRVRAAVKEPIIRELESVEI